MPQCPVCSAVVSTLDQPCPDCGTDLAVIAGSGAPMPEPAPASFSPAELIPDAVPVPNVAAVSAVASAAARLILKRNGALTGERFELGDRVVIGRFDPESGPVDVDLGPLPEAAYVSRAHAELWRAGDGGWFIKDLGSRNGTFVRAAGQGQFQRADGEFPVSGNSEIALGNARFEFQVG